MSPAADSTLPEGQQEALAVLRSIAQASGGALTVDLDYAKLGGLLTVRIYLASASLLTSEKGIKLRTGSQLTSYSRMTFPIARPLPSRPPRFP